MQEEMSFNRWEFHDQTFSPDKSTIMLDLY